MSVFGETKLKGKKYFHLQHTLKPNCKGQGRLPSNPSTWCQQCHRTRSHTPEPLPSSGSLKEDKVPASETGCRVDFGSPPGGQLPMACLQVTCFSTDRISLNSLSWHRALLIRPCQPHQPRAVTSPLSIPRLPGPCSGCSPSMAISASGDPAAGGTRKHSTLPRPPLLRSPPHSPRKLQALLPPGLPLATPT